MALQDNVTKEYIKVLYEESRVQGDQILVAFQKYLSLSEREKEKTRLQSMRAAVNNIEAKKRECEIAMYGIIGENKEVSPELFEQLKNADPVLKKHWEDYCAHDSVASILPLRFYKSVSIPEYELDRNKAIAMGANPELIDDPIKMGAKITVNCGAYSGEKIEPALFYQKLKGMLKNPCIDC